MKLEKQLVHKKALRISDRDKFMCVQLILCDPERQMDTKGKPFKQQKCTDDEQLRMVLEAFKWFA